MYRPNLKNMSRLKKKLLLYFILISVVSISVSAEIILEMSAPELRKNILKNAYTEMSKKTHKINLKKLDAKLDQKFIFEPIRNLRNRMILLLLVVSGSIIGAFFMFTKDIVHPMDGMVTATKQIADGDLTVTVPVMTSDEIGQMGMLINNMNTNLQDMIMQIKQEISRQKKKIVLVDKKISSIVDLDEKGNILNNKKIKVSDYKKIMSLGKEVVPILDIMITDLSALQTFVNMYKTYSIQKEINQDEIDNAFQTYQVDDNLDNSKEELDS